MNTGIIATRYATALLKLVDETGSGEIVAAQARVIEKALDEVQEFRRAIDDPAVSPARKILLFEAAVVRQALSPVAESAETTSLAPELRKFIDLLIRNGRIGDSRLIFTTFIIEYFRSRHMMRARLVVAESPRADLQARLRTLIEKETGCKLILKTEVNPSLLGGFVFEVEDMVLDASVSHQLDVIRHQFIEKNRRIV